MFSVSLCLCGEYCFFIRVYSWLIIKRMRVYELAKKEKIASKDLLKIIKDLGIKGKVSASSLSEEEIKKISSRTKEKKPQKKEERVKKSAEKTNLIPRAPIITLMGHVDHGKTSLLDVIRESRVVDTEYGEITQHIGAYRVKIKGKEMVFLDTPGHEAFTAMRARGAKVTDIVILVVAVDDGVMPQTVEAINHCKEAKVPIIVALNKMDKPGINLEKVKQELAKLDLAPEEWGGKTVYVETSARTKTGIPNLLDMLGLEAEMLELKADPGKPGKGTVIEAKVDKREGRVINVIVRDGTIRVGDNFVVGDTFGRVKALINEAGKHLKEAGPSTPIKIPGCANKLPSPGDLLQVVASEKEAKEIVGKKEISASPGELAEKSSQTTLEDLYREIKEGKKNELKLIIKGDVVGSIEALGKSLKELTNPEIKIDIIHQSAGGINESDIMLASVSNAVIVGFNVPVETKIKELAKKEKIDLRTYQIIYEVIEDIKKAISGLLKPKEVEEPVGEAEIRRVFTLSNGQAIAGCLVAKGKVIRGARARLVRGEKVLADDKIASLRRFKDNAREVGVNFECGIQLENFNDFKAGDRFQIYRIVEQKQ